MSNYKAVHLKFTSFKKKKRNTPRLRTFPFPQKALFFLPNAYKEQKNPTINMTPTILPLRELSLKTKFPLKT